MALVSFNVCLVLDGSMHEVYRFTSTKAFAALPMNYGSVSFNVILDIPLHIDR